LTERPLRWRDAFRNRLPPTQAFPPRLRRAVLGGLGTAAAIAAMEAVAAHFGRPLALIPFVTSIVLVLCLPEAEPAKPRSLIGGHLASSLCGYLVLFALGNSPATVALAVGLSAFVMQVTRTMHPPAGIDPLLVVHEQLGPDFLIYVVLPGALALAAFAALWKRLSRSAL
jgi:CBS-domain-containing membrane protein